jgi:hypothetical protein
VAQSNKVQDAAKDRRDQELPVGSGRNKVCRFIDWAQLHERPPRYAITHREMQSCYRTENFAHLNHFPKKMRRLAATRAKMDDFGREWGRGKRKKSSGTPRGHA